MCVTEHVSTYKHVSKWAHIYLLGGAQSRPRVIKQLRKLRVAAAEFYVLHITYIACCFMRKRHYVILSVRFFPGKLFAVGNGENNCRNCPRPLLKAASTAASATAAHGLDRSLAAEMASLLPLCTVHTKYATAIIENDVLLHTMTEVPNSRSYIIHLQVSPPEGNSGKPRNKEGPLQSTSKCAF